jgi:hypothetical protein
VYVPSLATTFPELAGRIRVAVATVSLDLLNNVWTEIEYKYDITMAARFMAWVLIARTLGSQKNFSRKAKAHSGL